MTTEAKIDLAQVRADERLLVSTIQQDYPELAQRGQRYSIPRGHDADSLSVYRVTAGRYAGEWRWTRFGTGESGSVIDWMMAYRGASDVASALEMLGVGSGPRRAVATKTRPVEERPRRVEQFRWEHSPEYYLEHYVTSPMTVGQWRKYRPGLTGDLIEKHRLGWGALPYWWSEEHQRYVPSGGCIHGRIIYPVWLNGKLVGFRGRAGENCERHGCPKWLSAKGIPAVLYGIQQAPPGAGLIVCESPVDAMLANAKMDGAYAVAPTAGAGTWRDEWTEQIVMANPASVVVWFDNDLAGTPNARTYQDEIAAWRQRIDAKNAERQAAGQRPINPSEPQPNGPKLVERLAKAGLKVSAYAWPNDAPVHADLGWVLEKWA